MGKTPKPRHVFAGTTRQIRLRVDEGLVPRPEERQLRTHDRSGQRLRDVVDSTTGFCVGVTGPMESDGTSVRAAKPTSGGGAPLPVRDPRTGLWWVGKDRLVVRTESTPAGPIRRARLLKCDDSGQPIRPARTPKPVTPRQAANPRTRKAAGFTDQEISAYLIKTFGINPTLTPKIRSAARAAMVKAATMAEYRADMQASKKGLTTSRKAR